MSSSVLFVLSALWFAFGLSLPPGCRMHHTKVTRRAVRLFSTEDDARDRGRGKDILAAPIEAARQSGRQLARVLSANPISRVIINSYNFWYWLPKRNMPYDMPWQLFKNSTVEWLAWYQFPHNLPPYRYLPVESDGPFGGYRDDFFCYGLPGNTLPLGNWDPTGFQLTHKKVVIKYRESELKHGRLAMISSMGFAVGEVYHPLHPEDVGGMAITHMNQLALLGASQGVTKGLFESLRDLGVDSALLTALGRFPLEYAFVLLFLASFEVYALKRNWTRWKLDEYNHQFDHNIGIGNLRPEYQNGNYSFDPLHLRPYEPKLLREVEEMELNHGRLACIAIVGMIGQEYLTGLPIFTSLKVWLGDVSYFPLPSSSSFYSAITNTYNEISDTFHSLVKSSN